MRIALLLALLLGPALDGADVGKEYAPIILKIQAQLPPGWRAELKQFSTAAIVITSPRMLVISTDGSRISDEPRDGAYSLSLNILPYLPPADYNRLQARNDALRSQLGPRSKMESEHNKRILAQIASEPDIYDQQFSYSIYSSLRPAAASDVDACKQVFERLLALFRVYPQSKFSDPQHFERTLHWQL